MLPILWLPVQNTEAVAIPPYGIMSVSGIDEVSGAAKVAYPAADSQTDRLLVNGPSAIPAGGSGQAHATPIGVAAYQSDNDDNEDPVAGEEWGVVAGDWFLHRGYGGFQVLGGANGVRVNVMRTARGASAGFRYIWSTSTASTDPGAGKVKRNNATFASVTELYISETDADGNSLGSIIPTWDDAENLTCGYLEIYVPRTARMMQFKITRANPRVQVDQGAWDKFTVTPLQANGTIADGDEVYVHFVRAGDVGVSAGYSYAYDTTTTATDPTAGRLQLNNTTLSSATKLYISETDGNSRNLATLLAAWDDNGSSSNRGLLQVSDTFTPSNAVFFTVTGSITDNGAWDTFDLTYLTHSGSFADDAQVTVLFIPAGPSTAATVDTATVATEKTVPAYTISGGGTTLTANAVGAWTVDGRSLVFNDIFLLNYLGTSTAADTGLWKVTTAGSGGAALVATKLTPTADVITVGLLGNLFVNTQWSISTVSQVLPVLWDFHETRLSGSATSAIEDVATTSTLYLMAYTGPTTSGSNGRVLLATGGANGRTYLIRYSHTPTPVTLPLSGLVASTLYYVYLYYDTTTGALALEVSTTAPLNGQKTGDSSRKWIGAIYTVSTTATADNDTQRYLWNVYNQVRKRLFAAPSYVNNNAQTDFSFGGAGYAALTGASAVNYINGKHHDVALHFTAHATPAAGTTLKAGIAFDAAAASPVVASNIMLVAGQITCVSGYYVDNITDGLPVKRTAILVGMSSGAPGLWIADFARGAGGTVDPYATYLIGHGFW